MQWSLWHLFARVLPTKQIDGEQSWTLMLECTE